ncbi:hypothetical protein N7492_007497 [Penicillium capsulatum]|uniref:Rhodanese domain-containing protein n=1 Tax=Penicillium capsulatum TaxID=69766 RepID=A0A9W9I440_9EURO|nr:hypothetical protein N7492_007497 [Penicillium capsulatum]
MARSITAEDLRRLWANHQEVALLDVREEGPYAEAHPLFVSCPIVLYDNGEGYVSRAVDRIHSLGYQDVAIFEGGLSSYARVGEVYRDVNVPSKAFGELVESINYTPSLSAAEVKTLLDSEKDVGFDLETQKTERAPQPSTEATEKAREHAKFWAGRVGVNYITGCQLGKFIAEAEDRTLYLLDVRDPEEFAIQHPPNLTNSPGGQLVQATDEWVGVRGARVVLYDTDGAYVLEEDTTVPHGLEVFRESEWHPQTSNSITAEELEALEATVVDLARSPLYSKGHIPGAWFASGPELARDLKAISGTGLIVLTSPDGRISAMNIDYARKSTSRQVKYLTGGTAAWTAAGHPLETQTRWLSQPIDVYKRP